MGDRNVIVLIRLEKPENATIQYTRRRRTDGVPKGLLLMHVCERPVASADFVPCSVSAWMPGKSCTGKPNSRVTQSRLIGYLSIAAHGHADAFSVWLSGGKQPIFGDARAYLITNGALRDTFRQTVHNTPTLAGSSSSRPSGPFSWAKGECGLDRFGERRCHAGRHGA